MDLKNANKISNETKPILKVKNSIKEYVILCCGLALVLVSMPMGGSGGGRPPLVYRLQDYKFHHHHFTAYRDIFIGGGAGGIGPP